MRLLVDQNLSHRLVASLANEFVGSVHVRDASLATASDSDIWQYARQQGLVIVEGCRFSTTGIGARLAAESGLAENRQLLDKRY
jgi:hypothetical protein